MNKFKHHYYNSILKESDKNSGFYIGDIYCSDMYIRELPSFFKDLEVGGGFYVNDNELTSCKNFPSSVFDLDARNNKISSLEGISMIISSDIMAIVDLSENKISNVEELNKWSNVNLHSFTLSWNPLESLKGLENITISRIFECSYTHIKTLKYCPKSNQPIRYSVYNNKIESLEGCPKYISTLVISDNKIKSLKFLTAPTRSLYIKENDPIITYDDITNYYRDSGIYIPYSLTIIAD